MRRPTVLMALAMVVAACSGSERSIDPGSTGGEAGQTGGTGGQGGSAAGGDGGTSAGGTGGSIAGGSGGSSNGGSGGSAPGGTGGQADGGPDGDVPDGAGGSDACEHTVVGAIATPVDLYLMADRSGSMTGTKWDGLSQGIQSFASATAAQGTYLALGFFPNDDQCNPADAQCGGAVYAKPLLDFGELPGHATGVVSTLQGTSPDGCYTPTQDALNGLLAGSKARQQYVPSHQVAAVLLSDGEPCCGTCPCEDDTCIGGLVTPYTQGSPPIKTFAVYLDPAAQGVMEVVAQAGGTSPAINGGAGAPAVQAALENIRSQMSHCKYALPDSGGVVVGADDVDVLLDPGSGPTLLQRVPDAAQCGTTGGWYVDSATSATAVTLCPAYCQVMETTPGAAVQFDLGCDSGGTGGSGGAGGTGGAGGSCGQPPDACPGQAIALTGSGLDTRTGSVHGDTSGYCRDVTITCAATSSAPDVVYSFRPDVDGLATIELSGDAVSIWDATLMVRSVCGDAASELGCSDVYSQLSPGGEVVSFSAVANTTYYVFVGGYATSSGAFELQVSVMPPACGNGHVELPEQCDDGNQNDSDLCHNDCTLNLNSAVDTCPGVELTLSGTGTQTRTASATSDTSYALADYAGTCGASSAAKDMVFQVTPDIDGTMELDLGGASATPWDAVLYVETSCGDVASEVACHDAVGNGGETITTQALAGQTYYVIVDGYNDASGPFTLNVAITPAYCGNSHVEGGEQCDDGNTAPGDGCDASCMVEKKNLADACPGEDLELTASGAGWTGSVTGTTVGMTPVYAGVCGSSALAPDQVYHVKSPITGQATVSLPPALTTFDSVLYVQSGACEGPGAVSVGCEDGIGNGGETITFDAVANADYWIFVDGYSTASGAFGLDVSIAPGCGNAIVDPGEGCDDGNLSSGDGCAQCQVEAACGAFSTTEADSPTTPRVIPASCGTWLVPSGALTVSDADYFSFSGADGATIELESFVSAVGNCPAGTSLVTSLWKGSALAAAPNNGLCATQAGATACSDSSSNGSCTMLSYVVPSGIGGTWQVKVHSRDVGSTVSAYGLLATVR